MHYFRGQSRDVHALSIAHASSPCFVPCAEVRNPPHGSVPPCRASRESPGTGCQPACNTMPLFRHPPLSTSMSMPLHPLLCNPATSPTTSQFKYIFKSPAYSSALFWPPSAFHRSISRPTVLTAPDGILRGPTTGPCLASSAATNTCSTRLAVR